MNEVFHFVHTVLSFVSSLFTVIIGGVTIWQAAKAWYGFRRQYKVLPSPAPAPKVGKLIVLGVQHCRAPAELKGKDVLVTGIVVERKADTEPATLKLHAFPFAIPADITCEFLKADSPRALDELALVSVIGIADDAITPEPNSSRCHFRLKNCRVLRPAFFDWLRYKWVNSAVRHRWYFGF